MLHTKIRSSNALRSSAEVLERTFNSVQLKANSSAASRITYPSAQATINARRPESPSNAVSEIYSNKNACVTLIPVHARAAIRKSANSLLHFFRTNFKMLPPIYKSAETAQICVAPPVITRPCLFILRFVLGKPYFLLLDAECAFGIGSSTILLN